MEAPREHDRSVLLLELPAAHVARARRLAHPAQLAARFEAFADRLGVVRQIGAVRVSRPGAARDVDVHVAAHGAAGVALERQVDPPPP